MEFLAGLILGIDVGVLGVGAIYVIVVNRGRES